MEAIDILGKDLLEVCSRRVRNVANGPFAIFPGHTHANLLFHLASNAPNLPGR
jgi:hypothetical protein